MKLAVWLVSMPLILSGCATAQRPVQVTQVCPRVPALELDVPAVAWRDWMQSFLQGTPTPLPDYNLHSTPAKLPTTR